MSGNNANSGRAGDWFCMQCGDKQFARNIKCRKCSAPKPVLTGGESERRENNKHNTGVERKDWNCSNCGDFQFARNNQCRKCSAKPRPTGEAKTVENENETKEKEKSQVQQLDDWTCPKCYTFQFARNPHCRKCFTDKPVMKKGDWICLICNIAQFASNKACKKCNLPPPTEEQKEIKRARDAEYALYGKEDWNCRYCGASQFHWKTICGKCAHHRPTPSELKAEEDKKREQEEELQRKIKEFASVSWQQSDCWAAKNVMPKLMEADNGQYLVVTADADPEGYKDWPEMYSGCGVAYKPHLLADKKFVLFTYAVTGFTKKYTPLLLWNEAELMVRLSFDPDYLNFQKPLFGTTTFASLGDEDVRLFLANQN